MSIRIQRCADCGTWNYPARSVCRQCLSDDLPVTEVEGLGDLLAAVDVHHSLDAQWRDRLPLRISTVRLDCGAHVVCFVEGGITAPARVRLEAEAAEAAEQVWTAKAAFA